MEFIHKTLKNWLYVDTQTLALFRIYFGFICLLDVLRRYGFIEVFYSDAGMNFRRQVYSKYSIKYFTLLEYFHTTIEVQIFFIITVICFLFFIIGLYTRFFQILSTAGLISIHNAAVILENGGDLVFNCFLIWTLFLPLGRSLSIDSIRKSLKINNDSNSNALNQPIVNHSTLIFHFGYVACLVQLSIIYFFTYYNKSGDMWRDGTAIYYMYQLETFLTPIGEWIAKHINMTMSNIMTLIARPLQLFASVAILFPFFQPWLRRVVIILFFGFHAFIEISLSIGLFSWVMFAGLILLLSGKDINKIKSLIAKLYRREYMVFYDHDCGFCHYTARIIKRMDVFSRLKWADSLSEGKKPLNLDALIEKTIVVWDPKTEEIWTRHIGFSKILSALPLGFLVSWILRIPGLEKIFGYKYDLISNHRSSISQFMGLPACSLRSEKSNPLPEKQSKALVVKGYKVAWIFSNMIVFGMLIGSVDYAIQENIVSNKNLKNKKIKKAKQSSANQNFRYQIKRLLLYPRMHQKWGMFSPNVLKYEKWNIANVTFEDGETLSLFNNNDNIKNRLKREYCIPYNRQFWRKFLERLGSSNYQKHIPKFKKWLSETDYFPEYRGRNVSKVELFRLSEKSPSPNTPEAQKPRVVKRILKEREKDSWNRKNKKINTNKKNHKLKLKKKLNIN